MNIEIDYHSFCNTYYKTAEQVADITVIEHIKKHGDLNPYIDVELVKDLGVSYGLEKAYNTYDIDHESKAKIKTYLSKVVRNCVLTELKREASAVGGGNRPAKSMDSMIIAATIGGDPASLESFSATVKTSGRFKRKEDLIAKMLECIKKLNGVDQIIITCWMNYPKREYTGMAIEELGWEDNARTRNVVNVRCNRAMEMLGRMMEGARKASGLTFVPKASPDADYNFTRRRQRAAKSAITSKIDYKNLVKAISSSLPD